MTDPYQNHARHAIQEGSAGHQPVTSRKLHSVERSQKDEANAFCRELLAHRAQLIAEQAQRDADYARARQRDKEEAIERENCMALSAMERENQLAGSPVAL